jgi:hypothetical protein
MAKEPLKVDVVTPVVSNLASWTWKTVLMAFFLGLMGAVYYLYTDNQQLNAKVGELSAYKGQVEILREKCK